MKKLAFLFALVIAFGCGSNKSTSGPSNLQKELDKKNSGAISLLTQIRQKPGIVLKNGVPALQQADNSFNSLSQEPLYVLDDLIIGNSFRSINQVVNNVMVKKIEVLKGAETTFYGSRGANGVIKITTFSGEDDEAKEN